MHEDLLYQIALTMVPHVGPVHAKILLQHFTIKEIFAAKKQLLEKIPGIGEIRARSIHAFRDFNKAEDEIRFIEQYHIRALFPDSNDYPRRLLHCYDSPSLLYYKGNADLNAGKIISVVGTRNHTDYGKQLTDKFVAALATQKITVVSGLAYGIDALAHKAALRNQLPTIGTLAHGLDSIYPPEHNALARDMLAKDGGLLTEFRSKTIPDRHHFPVRNRVVAGMSDATVVIESGIKGGSIITAQLANDYNKDVFAFPGKTTDHKSGGCNHLIYKNQAILIRNAADLLEIMGWQGDILGEKRDSKKQKELFVHLDDAGKKVAALLQEKATVHIDELTIRSNLSSSELAAAILSLELQNLIVSLPGRLYRLA